MDAACREALRWQQTGSAVSVAVKVSPVEFAKRDFVDTVIGALLETGLDPSRLELELPEGALIRDIEQGPSRLDRLRGLGTQIAIDNFGTGYSSLSYLRRMPVDALKIDRSFVRDLDRNPHSLSFVRAIVAMAKAFGLRVVAEGVQTEAQSGILCLLGCDAAQGCLFGRPESPESALKRVAQESAS